jgi:heat shock protein HslJ
MKKISTGPEYCYATRRIFPFQENKEFQPGKLSLSEFSTPSAENHPPIGVLRFDRMVFTRHPKASNPRNFGSAHTPMKTFLRLNLITITVLSLVHGGEPGAAPNAHTNHAALADVTWIVKQIGDKSIAAHRPELTLDMARGTVFGFTGVNRCTGRFAMKGDWLDFGPFATTRRAGPREAMITETLFLRALEEVNGWRIAGDRLEFLKDGVAVMKLARKPQPF